MLRLVPLGLVLVLMLASFTAAQNDLCDRGALLPRTDPAYADATELAKTLTRHGISIRCVLLSKEARMFEGQLGAAFFASDIGNFEALFLPRPKTWNELEIVEQREQGGYTRYHFRGAPKYSGTWEGKSVNFVKHWNQLLHSLDEKTVAKLREAFQRE